MLSPEATLSAQLEVRHAAKGLISVDEGKYVFVAGQRGMLNLPGGGQDPDETAREAFLREAEEELGIDASDLLDVDEAFSLQGETTSATGVRRLARWTVYKAGLSIPVRELRIPDDSEITAITALRPEQCLSSPIMSTLAKRAVATAMNQN